MADESKLISKEEEEELAEILGFWNVADMHQWQAHLRYDNPDEFERFLGMYKAAARALQLAQDPAWLQHAAPIKNAEGIYEYIPRMPQKYMKEK